MINNHRIYLLNIINHFDVNQQALSKQVTDHPHIVESTNREGIIEKLEGLQSELTICEKTLAEYLEIKRLAFPRFYFVSTADLLDILSNGNNPIKVAK